MDSNKELQYDNLENTEGTEGEVSVTDDSSKKDNQSDLKKLIKTVDHRVKTKVNQSIFNFFFCIFFRMSQTLKVIISKIMS
jgi:hypothetical protein